jgi:hypothetical protein
MKINLFFTISIYGVILAIPSLCHAQATKWQDVPNRKGIQAGYNKYEDRTTVMTDRIVVKGSVGKGNLLDPSANERTMEMVAGFVHNGQKMSSLAEEIMIAIMPEASTKFGKFFQSLEKEGDKGTFYISPDSKVIILADGGRFDLGTVSKSGTLNVWGDYKGTAYVSMPVESFRKIAAAKKVEMAVGNIEIKLLKRDVERLHSLLDEYDARVQQINSSSSK